MITREFIGNNKDELIEEALDILKLTRDHVQIDVNEDSGAIMPFSKKKVIVKISYDEEDAFGNRCLLFIKNLLEKMNVEAKIYLIEESDDIVVIEIESPESSLIIGKKGQHLEAIQTIVNSAMNKNAKKWTKVIIDSENYRSRRERNLQYIASKAVSEVRRTKKSILLEPMTPFERRIVHVALQDEEDIKTESIGEGLIKKIKIEYIKK